jgi:hypothetical protein
MSAKHERRNWLRLDKVFPVLVESPLHGYVRCIARNISCGGLFLETLAPLPLGTPIRVFFAVPESAAGISAVGQVKNHYFLNFASLDGPKSITGMGVRFMKFDADGAEQLEVSLKSAHAVH